LDHKMAIADINNMHQGICHWYKNHKTVSASAIPVRWHYKGNLKCLKI
jgi:hypothetical protein